MQQDGKNKAISRIQIADQVKNQTTIKMILYRREFTVQCFLREQYL